MYDVIYSDPPWRQRKGGKRSVRPAQDRTLDYPTVSEEGILDILSGFSAQGTKDHVLFMWTIDKYLWQAENMASTLGYKLHARIVWNKMNGIPAAFTIRFGHEYLLWFYKERLPPIAKDQRGKWHSVLTEKSRRHSQKPEIAYQFIESIYPEGRKIELFARNRREGWESWGNEV